MSERIGFNNGLDKLKKAMGTPRTQLSQKDAKILYGVIAPKIVKETEKEKAEEKDKTSRPNNIIGFDTFQRKLQARAGAAGD